MTQPSDPSNDFDSPWKEALEYYFPQFMALLFPEAHAEIDWSRPHEFLDTELQKIVRDAESGRRHTDKLVKVFTLGGVETWVLIHVEIQGKADRHFNRRMYRYHYRLQDRHPNRRIASFAILTDRNPVRQLGHYRQTLWHTEIDFKFPVIRLQDWHDHRTDLENSPNPFALVVLAQLDAHRTRQDDSARKAGKFGLIRLLLSRDYARQDIMELLRVIDWLMQLPDELERQLTDEIKQLEAETMTYVMSIERLALEQGKLEGRMEGRMEGKIEGKAEGKAEGKIEGKIEGEAGILQRLLVKRFGPLPDVIQQRLDRATSEQLEIWAERVLDAPNLPAVFDDH